MQKKESSKSKLRIERSQNSSGKLKGQRTIPVLKEENYYVLPFDLGGDAPKQFIKAYFFEKGGAVFKRRYKTWKPFIAKTAEKWYPHESVIEFLINKIGEVLGLKMNTSKLIIANTQIRFLSEYFLNPKLEVMIHGAEICGEYLQDEDFAVQIANDKNSARELFNFEFISESIKSIFQENYDTLMNSERNLLVLLVLKSRFDKLRVLIKENV